MSNNLEFSITARDLATPAITNVGREVDNVTSKSMNLNDAFNKIGITLGIAFAVDKIKNFAGAVIDAGTTVENATTGLTTLLGDSAAAAQVVQDTMVDATKTPFAFEGLLQANKALISAGVSADRARTDVTNLANAIAATGGGDDELGRMVVNMQQIRNTGKATAMDIKQFAFAGVNIYKVLADATGQPIAKVKDMEVSYDLLTMALEKAHQKGGVYFNGLENMANNTSVRISNLGDSTFQFMNQIFVDFKPLIDSTIGSLASFIGSMRDAYEWVKKNSEIFKALAVGITTAAVAWGVYTVATNTAAIASAATTVALYAVSAAVFVLENVLTFGIPAAIAVVSGALYYCYQKFDEFRAVVDGTWQALKTTGGMILTFFKGLGTSIMGAVLMKPDMIKSGFTQMADAFKDGGKKIGESYKKGFNESMADSHKRHLAEDANKEKKPSGIKAAASMGPLTTAKSKTAGVKGTSIVNVNIKIGNLINDFQIKTTNLNDSSKAVKDQITSALMSAVNDSQLVIAK